MSAFAYPARFTAGSDGRVLVEFVDLARVAADGKDDREAIEEAMDALESDLSIRLSRREEVPTPSAARHGQRLVPVPLWLAPKLALYLAMRDQQINNSELARRLGVHERVVRRMLDPLAFRLLRDNVFRPLTVLRRAETPVSTARQGAKHRG